ncbi:MAG: 50S ribosomal protein L30e [Candidatus Micrarchaeota archaeon]
MDLAKSIRFAVDTGKVELGLKQTLKIALNGGAKLVIIAKNCPSDSAADVKRFASLGQIPLVVFEGTSIELGTACGKPFPVSTLSVIEEGNSDVLKAIKH